MNNPFLDQIFDATINQSMKNQDQETQKMINTLIGILKRHGLSTTDIIEIMLELSVYFGNNEK